MKQAVKQAVNGERNEKSGEDILCVCLSSSSRRRSRRENKGAIGSIVELQKMEGEEKADESKL